MVAISQEDLLFFAGMGISAIVSLMHTLIETKSSLTSCVPVGLERPAVVQMIKDALSDHSRITVRKLFYSAATEPRVQFSQKTCGALSDPGQFG